ncbi:substrate-binding domain-containing protein, partial [Streptomyces sp. NRRL S-481]
AGAGLRLADEPGCTAVFAANDQMALGLLRALHERGLRVPGDISVIGFAD